ncbi:inter-alpha-trypsin inhibitor heavy chain H4 isoform X2 [Phodopus roborovskii]|uniref:inter-alpha-trypsin inhibitor heavy chain H4 isoform X2 n=1 Tax=Phodopus roborovskii TaxID=109678 RepID=UPI0021E38F4A|nr:inter-alpha-trypsin inhibitor heavy chain H4 isoform X2 [Phodopus roborovskii]
MKSPAPAHMWNIVLVLPSLLAVLQTTTAKKNGIDIYSLTVDSQVSSRFAHTVVTSRVVNRANSVQEATFQIELPRKAFITNFSMVIDGVTYPGIVQDKAAAQEQYSAAVSRGESAGLVKTAGRQTEQFEVSVTVAPNAKITFELVYQELLRRRLGTYELLLKVKPQQLVKHLQMDIHIFEPQGIRLLETESTFMTQELADALTTSQNKTKAHIRFKPTLSQQQKSQNEQDTVLDGNFIVRYDVDRSVSGGSIQIENGYFVHHFAPEDLPTMPKNVIFVIDKSGSMSGKKIQQTREALIKILNDLSPKDQFNLIVFNWEATQWASYLVEASEENLKRATEYASKIRAQGGTNINDAMLLAVKLLDSSNQAELLPSGSVSLIILLTDGEPTEGETNPANIRKNVQEAINDQYSLFCLGFGFDVHYSFLEKLAQDNGGLARRIYEDSDSALQLQDFYHEVANPLLLSVAFEYPSNAVEVVTQDNFRHHFKGSEMVVAGKLQDQGLDVLSAKISGQMHKQNITFQTEARVAQKEEEFQSPKYIFHNFMERLWALLTIHQQLEQMVSASGDELKALESQALNLSLKYSFVTPLTHMVVTKPEGQEQFQVAGKPVEADNGLRSVLRGQAHFFKSRARRPGPLQPAGTKFRKDPKLDDAGTALREHKFPGLRGPPGDLYLTASFVGFNPSLNRLMGRIPDQPHLSTAAPVVSSQAVLQSTKKTDKDSTIPDELPQPAQSQHFPIILPLPGSSVDQLCVDIRSREALKLFEDPEQGLFVAGEYGKGGFSWIKVNIQKPHLHIHATPERLVVTRDRKNSEYKWKQTLFFVLPGLKMTMDKMGLLRLSGPDRVDIALVPMDEPQKGLMLLVHDTQHFSNRTYGELGRFYQGIIWDPPVGSDDTIRTLRVQGTEYSATRQLRLKYQEGSKGTDISCWTVKI